MSYSRHTVYITCEISSRLVYSVVRWWRKTPIFAFFAVFWIRHLVMSPIVINLRKWKFHGNPLRSFCAKLLTDKTDGHRRKKHGLRRVFSLLCSCSYLPPLKFTYFQQSHFSLMVVRTSVAEVTVTVEINNAGL